MSSAWKRALIVGASSGIGEALARALAREGCEVALVARRESELERIQGEIAAEGKGGCRIYVHDVREFECVPSLFQKIAHDLGGLDLVIYSSGVMPSVPDDGYAFDLDRQMIEVNLLGAIVWLNEAAQRFRQTGSGTIIGISSVAGERGRRGNPVYGASKAGLNAYLESLRNRLSVHGVKVVTIKPGPVATPMTEGLDKLPMLITADRAAAEILSAARKGSVCAYVPARWRPIMWVLRSIPSPVFRRLNV